MKTSVKQVHLITKARNSGATELAGTIAGWLEAHGVSTCITENCLDSCTFAHEDKPDLMLVLGGDGTMLSVARRMVPEQIPLLGVNQGRLGFLSELTPVCWKEKLETILRDGLQVADRMALEWCVERNGDVVTSGMAVNEVVLNRGAMARLVNLDLAIDGCSLGPMRADGLLVSTPTGSSGYAVSAGGPLLDPLLDVFCVVPICTFLNDFRPLVCSGASTVEIEVCPSTVDTHLTVDGQEGVELFVHDRVRVCRASTPLRFATFGGSNYISKLRAKGFLSLRDPAGGEG